MDQRFQRSPSPSFSGAGFPISLSPPRYLQTAEGSEGPFSSSAGENYKPFNPTERCTFHGDNRGYLLGGGPYEPHHNHFRGTGMSMHPGHPPAPSDENMFNTAQPFTGMPPYYCPDPEGCGVTSFFLPCAPRSLPFYPEGLNHTHGSVPPFMEEPWGQSPPGEGSHSEPHPRPMSQGPPAYAYDLRLGATRGEGPHGSGRGLYGHPVSALSWANESSQGPGDCKTL